MRELPIIFQGEMVRAIQDGRKTQTRRIVKGCQVPKKMNEAIGRDWWSAVAQRHPRYGFCVFGETEEECARQLAPWFGPWKPGDLLYVRETFKRHGMYLWYKADGDGDPDGCEFPDGSICEEKWEPSIHMPKKYARVWLEVTGVRVERVQEISEEDADDEGADWCLDVKGDTFRERFHSLWDSINGKKPGCSWDDNPYVWVVEFKPVKGV